jgi:hypothetical protein
VDLPEKLLSATSVPQQSSWHIFSCHAFWNPARNTSGRNFCVPLHSRMKSATKGLEQTVWYGSSESARMSSSLPRGKPSIRRKAGSRSFSRHRWRKYCRCASPLGNVRPGRSTRPGDTGVFVPVMAVVVGQRWRSWHMPRSVLSCMTKC